MDGTSERGTRPWLQVAEGWRSPQNVQRRAIEVGARAMVGVVALVEAVVVTLAAGAMEALAAAVSDTLGVADVAPPPVLPVATAVVPSRVEASAGPGATKDTGAWLAEEDGGKESTSLIARARSVTESSVHVNLSLIHI